MKSRSRMLPLVFVLALVAGCASTNVTQSTPMPQPGLARPNRIWVYNFVANPADMPADSSIRNQISPSSTPPTPDQIQEGPPPRRPYRAGPGGGHQRDGA